MKMSLCVVLLFSACAGRDGGGGLCLPLPVFFDEGEGRVGPVLVLDLPGVEKGFEGSRVVDGVVDRVRHRLRSAGQDSHRVEVLVHVPLVVEGQLAELVVHVRPAPDAALEHLPVDLRVDSLGAGFERVFVLGVRQIVVVVAVLRENDLELPLRIGREERPRQQDDHEDDQDGSHHEENVDQRLDALSFHSPLSGEGDGRDVPGEGEDHGDGHRHGVSEGFEARRGFLEEVVVGLVGRAEHALVLVDRRRLEDAHHQIALLLVRVQEHDGLLAYLRFREAEGDPHLDGEVSVPVLGTVEGVGEDLEFLDRSADPHDGHRQGRVRRDQVHSEGHHGGDTDSAAHQHDGLLVR
mmetsp:Transcript_27557/g.64678  ORF Transcript_27557/g.64678 Transcript_27557/m.64678 type:complete len:351 (+) Transcript_27557:297-1349(+)